MSSGVISGITKFSRHFFGKHHWHLDVTYRVHNYLPVFNRLMYPLELTEAQVEICMNRPCKGNAKDFSFPEELPPACTRVDSSVLLMTMVNCILKVCHCGGIKLVLRKLWRCFRATLGPENLFKSLNWSRYDSLVRYFGGFSSILLWSIFSTLFF